MQTSNATLRQSTSQGLSCKMQADMDELVHMRLEGTMAELLVKLDPKLYRKYVQTVNGQQVLYVELKKALYGTMRGAWGIAVLEVVDIQACGLGV